ncbi:Helicase superfamily 1/2, ATP-binding domain,DEAD/DEAH box helicase domain,P-loop containing [Cinara cedri]|uniref:ATP-dependent RNA helicase n=1 Tax=Cinara cedri TaxID=506608 RepID=A0A5E4M4S6_9HEMI|nr:Helicase superfamily 1/2, ATP-binding domain,DEAD/DEAH box helicase domain,P-loop containing [Cinara cedri]
MEDNSKPSDFTLIDTHGFKNNKKVKRVLPEWLAKPTIVSVDLNKLDVPIEGIQELDPALIKKLRNKGYTHFFPVQTQLIPWLINVQQFWYDRWLRDVCISAPTGSGKTLSYVLPIIQTLQEHTTRQLRALIVLPTKDLAVQVFKVFSYFIKNTFDLKVVLLESTKLTLIKEKEKILRYDKKRGWISLVDIIVTTPGRLADHIYYTEGFSLKCLRFLVLDEADSFTNILQNDWLYLVNDSLAYSGPTICNLNVLEKFPQRTQRLLFSATLTQDPEKLKFLKLFEPKLFTSIIKRKNTELSAVTATDEPVRGDFVGKYTTPKELKEYMVLCPEENKPLTLYHLIRSKSLKRVICFVKSKLEVHRLARLLCKLSELDTNNSPLRVNEISSDVSQKVHSKYIKQFSAGKIDVLICTDSLARGIDIDQISCVILYNVPKYPKNYIHRIGRTARAGHKGKAITFVIPEHEQLFHKVLYSAGKTSVKNIIVDVSNLEQYEQMYIDALKSLKTELTVKSKVINKKVRKKNKPDSKM